MAKKIRTKAGLKKAFSEGNLEIADMGTYLETAVHYRGYYIDADDRTQWAGPWRNDNMAAAMDTFPYAQRGFRTGVRWEQN